VTAFLQLLILGMATGGFYTINALGLVTVFRSSGVINFASGGVAMVGGYLYWQFTSQLGWAQAEAIPVAVLLSAVMGVVVYLVAVRPLGSASTLTKVIATLAVLVSLQQAVILIFGGLPKLPEPFLPSRSVRIGSVAVGENSLIFLGFTIVLTFVLWGVYRRTRFGIATSALAENPRSIAALGWNVGRLRAANWAIGGALAGMAGVGLGPFLQLNTSNFTSLLIPTLASAIIGGLQSYPLTLVGGLLVGAAQAEAERYITWNGAGDAVPFVLIIGVLMLRGRSLPLRSFVQERLPRVGSGQIPRIRVIAVLIVVAVAAAEVNVNWVIGSTITLFAAIILLSQVVITGYAGQLSLAQLTMAGLGAIIAVNIAVSDGVPFLPSLLIGMIVVIPVSILLGAPSLRARGVSLAIATLGFAVAINSMVLSNGTLAGGASGLQLAPPSLFGWSIDAITYPLRYFYVTLAVFTLLALGVANLRRGRTGRRLLAVRNNERAATAMGINVAGTKLYAFTVAGSIAAAGGVLLAFSEAIPQFTTYDPMTSLTNLVDAVLGGIGYVLGPLFGGMFTASGLPDSIINPWTNQWTWWNEIFPLFTGVALIAQLIVNPNGALDIMVHGPARAGRRLLRSIPGQAQPSDTGQADTGQADSARPGSQQARDEQVGSAAPAGTSRAALLLTWLRSLTPAGSRQARVATQRRRLRAELARAAGKPRRPRGSTLAVSELRVSFGSVVALDRVSLTVSPGEVLGIIGPNGAGKTTLMDAVTGFTAARGTVELDGVRIDGWSPARRARAGLARSFQSLELLEDMTVIDNLRCASEPQDFASLVLDLVHPDRGEISAATAAAISDFGLEDKLDRLPTEIGYGDRRLVAIARAVAGEPSVLLLDEPAAGLSEQERAEVARLITMMARDWNIAVMLIEHDVELVRRVSDRVIALDFGLPIAAGTPDEVLSHAAVITAYLGESEEEDPGNGTEKAQPAEGARTSTEVTH
jgi:ABC-type branched-subunit amino acid transport system ATPase component/branched-subunit amino acid ABC-type transport system permease component